MIPVFMMKNGDMYKVFDGIQEAFQEVRGYDPQLSNNQVYDIINKGLDDHKSWHFEGNTYDFRTYKEDREKRADRKTR